MSQQAKAARRRWFDGAFHSRYLAGHGLDIDASGDPLAPLASQFPAIGKLDTFDLNGDPQQTMSGIADDAYDFVHSSFCLQRVRNVEASLGHFLRVVKPGGFVVVTVPDEDLYERGRWPSAAGPQHLWSFTMARAMPRLPRSINVVELVERFAHAAECERLVRHGAPDAAGSAGPTELAEAAIEMVLRKRQRPGHPGNASYPIIKRRLARYGGTRVAAPPGTGAAHAIVIPGATCAPWLDDAAFAAAFRKCQRKTMIDIYRCHELWTLVGQLAHLVGDVLQVGVWRGGTAALMGSAMAQGGIAADLVLADTWSGVAKASAADPYYKGGEHADASESDVRQLLAELGVEQRAVFLTGVFPEETASMIEDRVFRLCHVDVDTHDSARDTFEWVWPRLVAGGVVVFDDYGFLETDGVRRFVDSLRGRAGHVVLHNLNGHGIVIKTGG